MREILFRGKTIFGKWVYGTFIQSKHDCLILPENTVFDYNNDEHTKFINVYVSTIGQFTGLTDKNGVKIFEGDILKVPEDWNEYGVYAGDVYEVYFAFGGFRMKPKYNLNNKGFWIEDDKTFEVIGNIHDNHELLEEK